MSNERFLVKAPSTGNRTSKNKVKKTIALTSVVAIATLSGFLLFKDRGNQSEEANSDSHPTLSLKQDVSLSGSGESSSKLSATESQLSPQPVPELLSTVEDLLSKQEIEGLRDSDGNLPQGLPVVAAPSDQVLDDPRDFGGAIIPKSDVGTFVPGLMVEAFVEAGTASGKLIPNQNGVFPTIIIEPNGTAEVTLAYPDSKEGDVVTLNCPDGGTINGEPYLSHELGKDLSLSFTWQGNDDLGSFTVTSIANDGLDEKSLSFWSGPRAYADASAVTR